MPEAYSSRKIATNTIMLYIRMIVMMAVSFYTTRVLLKYLGVEDFGIYNVLMGIITLFSFISSSMTVATQRFISFELGRNNHEKVTQVFSASIYIYIALIFVSVILFETLGLWYVANYINIPGERIGAARVVYQLAIVQFVFMTNRIPYNAAVIAYEKMDFFAYVSILEAALSLGLIYFLAVINYDKLIVYSILITASKLLILFAYILFCRRHTSDCKILSPKQVEKTTFSEIWSFSGWNIFGSMAVTANNHGINLIINYFSGVVVNTSVGISTQLTMGLYNFVGNLQTAFSPQIIKLYAAREYAAFKELLFRNSKFCYFLYLLIAIPIFACTHYVLILWLGSECEYAVEFCQCMLAYLAIESIAYPLTVAIQADGNIKLYQILSGCLFLILIPLAILFYRLHLSPVWIFVARIIQNAALMTLRYFYLTRYNKLDLSGYLKNVVLRCMTITLLAFPIPFSLSNLLEESFINFLLITLMSVFITSGCIFLCGLSTNERQHILNLIKGHLSTQNHER